MKVVRGFPPNYAEIVAVLKPPPSAIFTYGDTIYSPQTTKLPPDLHAHEQVHADQQQRAGGPDAWWRRYLDDAEFRLDQEVAAYRAQWLCAQQLPRSERRSMLTYLCRSLASPMYGRLVSKDRAKTLICGTA